MFIKKMSLEVGGEDWPFSVPAVASLVSAGREFTSPITIIVGENGTGKSTLLEAIAEAYGMDPRGGHGGRRYAYGGEVSPLGRVLQLELSESGRSAKRRNPGFFLRSETALDVLNFMSDMKVPGYGERHLGTLSHGESYLQVMGERFGHKGLFLMDEPEAGLSFSASLQLIEAMLSTVRAGGQVICATHSPLLAAAPGADIWVTSHAGIERVAHEDLDMVQDWKTLLAEPTAFFRRFVE